jgi:hypothetical protein
MRKRLPAFGAAAFRRIFVVGVVRGYRVMPEFMLLDRRKLAELQSA